VIWKRIEEETPHAYQTGNWDGLRSEEVLVSDREGVLHVARMYEGTMDGSHFRDFYNNRDFEVYEVTHWCKIPMLF
jgi:hypothetical protein